MNSFSLLGNKKAPEPPQIKLSSQMHLNDLPAEISNQFVDLFNQIQESNSFKPQDNGTEVIKVLDEINNNYEFEIIGDLRRVAQKFDTEKVLLQEFSTDLTKSISDFHNSSHIRATPTQFIVRSADKIKDLSLQISQSLSAFESRMIISQNLNSNNILSSFLEDETNAIIRTSSKISRIQSKFDLFKTNIENKNINILNYNNNNNDIKKINSYSKAIKTRLDQYKVEIKRKEKKLHQTTDLFGISNLDLSQTNKSTLGFGGLLSKGSGLLGNSTKLNTGSTSSGLNAPSTAGKSPFSK